MPYTFTQLQADDLARMRRLNVLFAQVFDDAQSYGKAPPGDAYLRRMMGQPQLIVLVAEDDIGDIAGGLVAYELPKLERERSEIYLYDLAVAEAHRRRGVALGLIDGLRAMAAERGAWVVFVQADHGDDAAIALYQRLGAREEVLHFDLPVPGHGG
jgi:aminoglycoside 3-N-acetyltransferase I